LELFNLYGCLIVSFVRVRALPIRWNMVSGIAVGINKEINQPDKVDGSIHW